MESVSAQALRTVAPVLKATVDPASRTAGDATATAAGASSEADEPRAHPSAERTEWPEVSGRRRHAQAVHGARLLLMRASLQAALEVRHAKRVVQPLIEGVALSEPAVVDPSTPSRHDEYAY